MSTGSLHSVTYQKVNCCIFKFSLQYLYTFNLPKEFEVKCKVKKIERKKVEKEKGKGKLKKCKATFKSTNYYCLHLQTPYIYLAQQYEDELNFT